MRNETTRFSVVVCLFLVGNFVTTVGGSVISGLFNNPLGLASGSDGVVYIADSNNNRIVAMDAIGLNSTSMQSVFVNYFFVREFFHSCGQW